MNGTTFELHGVRLRLESELGEFAVYARAALAPFVVADEAPVDVISRLVWVDGEATSDLERAFGVRDWRRRPDRDLYLVDGAAYWLRIDDFRDLQIAVQAAPDSVVVTGRYHFHLGPSGVGESLRRLRYAARLPALRGRRFSTLLYYLFYHPVLWTLGSRDGWSVLHGGAVAGPGGALVLAGMPGCGKSTLAVALLADSRRTMLSDNLILHDGGRALACPELLLLDERSRERAGAGAARLRATGERRVFARDAYHVDRTELDPQPIAALLHVERGMELALERLTVDESAARLRAANTMAKEVRRIAIMDEVLDLVAGTRRPADRDAAGRLAASVDGFALTIPAAADLAVLARDEILPRLERLRR